MSDLNPCPFCGGAAERWDITGQDDPNEGGSVIQCTVCGASSPVHFERKGNLISSWNDRASNAPQQEMPPGGWPENSYECICGKCEKHFIGHKRDIICKECRASNAAPPQPCSYPQYCGREVCNCPRDAAPPQDKATISTAHFHGKELPLTSVLFALAGQEGNDGDEGSAMQAAGERILALEAQLAGATPAQPEAPISPMAAIAKDLREGTFRGVLPDAAPPNVEPGSAAPKGEKSFVERWTKVIKEMPFGEPSAAESARAPSVNEDGTVSLLQGPFTYRSPWIEVPMCESQRLRRATEARMLELARREDDGWIDNDDLMKLRALVIETFGEKK